MQVLELGILVHSVIIGISLGASQSPETIKPLLVALSFHQFFEGMGLGGCIYEVGGKYLYIFVKLRTYLQFTPHFNRYNTFKLYVFFFSGKIQI